MLRGLLLVLLLENAVAEICKGLENYKLEIQMKWSKALDSDFDKSMAVGGVVSVVHNKNFDLFTPNKNLTKDLRHLMQTNKIGPALDRLEKLQRNAQQRVHSFDYVTGAKAQDIIKLNVKMDGDKGATIVSFMGVLLGTPDYFFGYRNINMCEPTEVNGRQVHNFTKRYPAPKTESWVLGFDAGYDARPKVAPGSSIIPENKGVRPDKRQALPQVKRYATFTMTPGLYDGYFAFWKILVIVGVLSTAALVAFICLYPVCCKKQMLDVPVPLQDESQWAT